MFFCFGMFVAILRSPHSGIRLVFCGGLEQVPLGWAEEFRSKHHMKMVDGWAMTIVQETLCQTTMAKKRTQPKVRIEHDQTHVQKLAM